MDQGWPESTVEALWKSLLGICQLAFEVGKAAFCAHSGNSCSPKPPWKEGPRDGKLETRHTAEGEAPNQVPNEGDGRRLRHGDRVLPTTTNFLCLHGLNL